MNPAVVLPDLLSPRDVADRLGVSEQTLANWRSVHRYDLPFIKVGGAVRYDSRDVAAFIESRRVSFADPRDGADAA